MAIEAVDTFMTNTGIFITFLIQTIRTAVILTFWAIEPRDTTLFTVFCFSIAVTINAVHTLIGAVLMALFRTINSNPPSHAPKFAYSSVLETFLLPALIVASFITFFTIIIIQATL